MLPSGNQIEIAHGDQYAVITEVGAGLRLYEDAGIAVVEGYESHQMADSCRNQVCYPWINRTASGEWTYSGRTAHVGADNVAKATLNHGVARWRPFDVVESTGHSCTLTLVLHPVPEYPFATRLTVSYGLGEDGLTVTSTVENLDEVAVPFGLGFHPYFAVTTATIDGSLLCVPAASYLEVDDRLLPTGTLVDVDATVLDFRRPAMVDGVVFDVTYANLKRDVDGLFRATVVDGDAHVVEVRQDEGFPYFQVFSGDTLAPPRRRTSIALEPMTAPADALRSGVGRLTLEPGERWSGTWGVRRLR